MSSRCSYNIQLTRSLRVCANDSHSVCEVNTICSSKCGSHTWQSGALQFIDCDAITHTHLCIQTRASRVNDHCVFQRRVSQFLLRSCFATRAAAAVVVYRPVKFRIYLSSFIDVSENNCAVFLASNLVVIGVVYFNAFFVLMKQIIHRINMIISSNAKSIVWFRRSCA